jgi:predicted GNAT family acetyltransferase
VADLVLERVPDVSRFEARAGAFLGAREAENNLVLGLITGIKAGRTFGPLPPYFAVVQRGDTVVAASMRTPPHNLLLTDGSDPDALPLLVQDAQGAMPETPGLSGPRELAARAVDLWSNRTGATAHVVMAQRIYRLSRVILPRAAPGSARLARNDDRPIVVDWFEAFASEALPATQHPAKRKDAEDAATHWIGGRGLWVWVDDEVVAMAGASGRTPNGIRVGAVYTRPEKRRRGYATSLVAALSQAQLDAGRRFCFLYTDLANPTSNRIYQAIGYEPVCDVDEYRFEGPAAADT